jgi:hypothetical protein
VPLINALTLPAKTILRRYLATATDHRYNSVAGTLAANTYLSPDLDGTYINSGFAAVGRLALPMPLPASHVVFYEIQAAAPARVGTIGPAFGQAGGGVEICLDTATRVIPKPSQTILDW